MRSSIFLRKPCSALATCERVFTSVPGRDSLRCSTVSCSLEVSALTPLAPVDGPGDVVVGRHGVLLARDGRRAVFLPQVAREQGWDRDALLTHLCLKAGLPPDAWRAGAALSVFEAEVF